MNKINFFTEVKEVVSDNYMVTIVNAAGGTKSLGYVSKSEIRSDREGLAMELALKMDFGDGERYGIEKFISAVQSISKELSRY
jgi:hypothetical protein